MPLHRRLVPLAAGAALAAGVVLSLGACTTTHELSPAPAGDAVIQRLAPERAWRLDDGGRTLGFVVRFVDPRAAERCSFSVRNELHQELGTIDELGRVWRFVPHRREAEWVCTSTLARGAATLLGASSGARLVEVEFASMQAVRDAR